MTLGERIGFSIIAWQPPMRGLYYYATAVTHLKDLIIWAKSPYAPLRTADIRCQANFTPLTNTGLINISIFSYSNLHIFVYKYLWPTHASSCFDNLTIQLIEQIRVKFTKLMGARTRKMDLVSKLEWILSVT